MLSPIALRRVRSPGLPSLGRSLLSSTLAMTLVIGLLNVIQGAQSPAFGSVTNASCTPTISAGSATGVASGNDCIVTFTSGTGTWTAPSSVSRFRALVIGGGGGGGADAGGGGGGGGVWEGQFVLGSSPTRSFSFVVGGGGTFGRHTPSPAQNAGAGGLSRLQIDSVTVTSNGGAGGTAGTNSGSCCAAGGTGGTVTASNSDVLVPTSPLSGANGGNGPNYGSRTGGFAGGSGYSTSTFFPGGYSGGGGGGASMTDSGGAIMNGGLATDGGGAGASGGNNAATSFAGSGTANTGGGGGGGSAHATTNEVTIAGVSGHSRNGGAGGTGVVRVRYTLTPVISLSTTTVSGTVNSAFTGYTVSNSGGSATSFSVSPTLPAGLSLNASTGVITGTPTRGIASTSFTLTATNSFGTGTATFNLSVTSFAPEAPTISSVVPSDESLLVNFAAPSNDGGSTITGYQLQRSTDGSTWTTVSDSIASSATSHTVTGLTRSTSYYIRMAAKYSAGLGAWGYPWEKLYRVVNPNRADNLIQYEAGFGIGVNDKAGQNPNLPFTRVRYLMEATKNNVAEWVDADFSRTLNPISSLSTTFDSVSKLRVPTVSGGAANTFVIQGDVSDMTLRSSNPTTIGSGSGLSGRLELWAVNYDPAAMSGLTARGNSAQYDDSDTPSTSGSPGSYGSFQLHSLSGTKRTLFAWNHHGGTIPEVGFGNFTGTHSDWTFASQPAHSGNNPTTTPTAFSLGIYVNAPTTTLNQRVIAFDSNGGSSVSEVTFSGGSSVALPTNPTRDGFVFSGWSTSEVSNQGVLANRISSWPYTPSGASDITLYAIWLAALIAHEPIQGTAGNLSAGSPNSVGFTGNWARVNANKQSNAAVQDVLLESSNVFRYPINIGYSLPNQNMVAGTAVNYTARFSARQLSTPISFDEAATYYMSYLVIATKPGAAHFGFAMTGLLTGLPTTASDASKMSLLTGYTYNSRFGIDYQPANLTGWAHPVGAPANELYSATESTDTPGSASGNSYFVVVKMSAASSGNDKVQLKYFEPEDFVPVDGSTISDSDWDVTYTAPITGAFSHLGIQLEYGSAIDEIRLGRTYQAVTNASDQVTVTYNSQGGSAVSNGAFTVGGTIQSAPTAPDRDNFSFAGWFTSSTGGSPISFPYSPSNTSSFTLFAQWTPNQYTVTYDYDNATGGASTASSVFTFGGTAITLPTPTRTGYSFDGWYEAEALTGSALGSTYSPAQSRTIYAKWSASTFTITYNYNSATGGNSTATSTYTTGGTVITLPTPTRSGHTFEGWYEASNFSGSALGATYSPTSTRTIYAKWAAINYTVTYNLNGASGTAPTQATRTTTQTFTVASATGLSRDGYSFGGWSDGTNTFQPGGTYTVGVANVTLIAQWDLNVYTVTYSANNGSGQASRLSDSFTHGSSAIVLPARGTLTRAGYTFGGWSSSNSGTALVGNYTPTASVTLFAVWNPNTYTISYNTNGATGAPSVSSETYTTGNPGTNLAGVGNMTKIGQEFTGWATTADGSIVSTPFTTTESLTLYAIWSPVGYTVQYSLAGGNSSLPIQGATQYNQTFTLAAAATRAPNTSPAHDWAFVAWSDGVNEYAAGATYRMPDRNITLTAVWVEVFTVKYTMNGATTAAPSDSLQTSGATVTLAPAPQRPGFTFAGWKDQAGNDYEAGGQLTVGPNSYLIYAQWTPINYSVTYVLNGGTSAQPAPASVNLGAVVSVAPNPVRSGYRFDGWQLGAQTYGAGATVIVGTSSLEFTATWTAINYTVTYDMNGSPSTRPIVGDKTIGQTFVLANVPSRAGYQFAGWSDGTNVLNAGSTYTVGSSNVNLAATWTEINYSLTYALNGGSGSAPNGSSSLNIGDTFLVAAGASHSSRSFLGWSDGTNIYTPGQSYTVGAANIVLTAVWSGINYVITYDLNGGSGTTPTESAKQTGQSFVVSDDSGFSRANYTFGGWKIAGQPIQVGATQVVAQDDITLVAQWVPAFEVGFNVLGGTSVATLTYTGTALQQPANPVRDNFVFTGWTSSGSDVQWPFIPTGPVTLVAKWTQLSLYGLNPVDLTRLGTITASDSIAVSFSGSNADSAVSVLAPAGALPAGTVIAIDLVGNITRASNLISGDNNYLVSFVVSWITPEGTVPETANNKPLSMTITNATIKTGAAIYSVLGQEYIVLGRATQNGQVTISITEDPEIVVAATRPNVPTNVSAANATANSIDASWSAPDIDGGAVVSTYTATTNSGQSCVSQATTCTISGLTPSTDYTVTVVAANSVGPSLASSASLTVRTLAASSNNSGAGPSGGSSANPTSPGSNATSAPRLSLNMAHTRTSPTPRQMRRVAVMASQLPTGTIVTCRSYVAPKQSTRSQRQQAARIAKTTCAAFQENTGITVVLDRKRPPNAGKLPRAKQRPLRVEIWIGNSQINTSNSSWARR